MNNLLRNYGFVALDKEFINCPFQHVEIQCSTLAQVYIVSVVFRSHISGSCDADTSGMESYCEEGVDAGYIQVGLKLYHIHMIAYHQSISGVLQFTLWIKCFNIFKQYD